MKQIEPSLLSLNKEQAKNQLQQIRDLGLRFVHYDVMDGEFVPPTAFTTEFLDDLANLGLKPNVHLMVKNPDQWIDLYKNYQVNSIVFHAETQSLSESKRLLDKIHDLGILAGISVKPKTDLNLYRSLFKDCDIILIMSVEPGWGGQGFVGESVENIDKAVEAKKLNQHLMLQIDGGINFDYIKKYINQIDWFVTGSWFFKNIGHMDQYLDEFNKLS